MSMILAVPMFADRWHMDGGWWFGGMMLWMLLFWGLVAFFIAWLVRGGPPRSGSDDREAAIRILDRRFAQGEMTLEEYQERKGALTER
jgi:uncharacterized membrane protein